MSASDTKSVFPPFEASTRDLCPRCRVRWGLKSKVPGEERWIVRECVECFRETHRMCTACCNKNTPQAGPCDHYYRPNCPECKGAGWFPRAAEAQ